MVNHCNETSNLKGSQRKQELCSRQSGRGRLFREHCSRGNELCIELSSTAKISDEFLLSYGSKNMTQGSQNVLLLSNGKEGKEIHVLRMEGGVCLDLVGTLIQL